MSDSDHALDFNDASVQEIAQAVIEKRDIQMWDMPLHVLIEKLIQLQTGFGPNTVVHFGADYERNIYFQLEPQSCSSHSGSQSQTDLDGQAH